ncbi:MAG: glycogen-binding domain-containing protein [Verrucomicrobiota bacterium]|jgi:1,4-alpha-glucan branching enzyme
MSKRNQSQKDQGNGSRSAKAGRIEVVFALERTEANEVYLCGDFNQWSATNLPMIRRDDFLWEKTVSLPPGRYEYKFLVDGKWTADPRSPQEVVNAFGSTNSVAEVG